MSWKDQLGGISGTSSGFGWYLLITIGLLLLLTVLWTIISFALRKFFTKTWSKSQLRQKLELQLVAESPLAFGIVSIRCSTVGFHIFLISQGTSQHDPQSHILWPIHLFRCKSGSN